MLQGGQIPGQKPLPTSQNNGQREFFFIHFYSMIIKIKCMNFVLAISNVKIRNGSVLVRRSVTWKCSMKGWRVTYVTFDPMSL